MTLTKNHLIGAVSAAVVIALIVAAAWRWQTPSTPYVPLTPPVASESDATPDNVPYVRSPQFIAQRAAYAQTGDVSEAYLMEHIHAKWAHDIVVIFDDLLNSCGVSEVSTHSWPNDATVRIKQPTRNGVWTVKFENVHYDPDLTNIKYGKTKISEEIPNELPGHSYLFDLTKSEAGGSFQQADSVTLERHRDTTITHSVDMNYTVSSETTIGGEYVGVSMEEKLTATFGEAFHDETTTAQGESTAKTESHEFDVELEPLKATLVTLQTVDVHSSTPFDVNGVADWRFTIHIPGTVCPGTSFPTEEYYRWFYRGPRYFADHDNLDVLKCLIPKDEFQYFVIKDTGCTLTFGAHDDSGVTSIDEMLHGKDPRWPGMEKFGADKGWIESKHPHAGTLDTFRRAIGSDDRRLQLNGIQRRAYENTTRETITDVTGEDLDQVARDHSAERPPIGR